MNICDEIETPRFAYLSSRIYSFRRSNFEDIPNRNTLLSLTGDLTFRSVSVSTDEPICLITLIT